MTQLSIWAIKLSTLGGCSNCNAGGICAGVSRVAMGEFTWELLGNYRLTASRDSEGAIVIY
jgi:hypothetical protein